LFENILDNSYYFNNIFAFEETQLLKLLVTLMDLTLLLLLLLFFFFANVCLVQ